MRHAAGRADLDPEEDYGLEVVLAEKRGHGRYRHGKRGLLERAEMETSQRRGVEFGDGGPEGCRRRARTRSKGMRIARAARRRCARTSGVLLGDHDGDVEHLWGRAHAVSGGDAWAGCAEDGP